MSSTTAGTEMGWLDELGDDTSKVRPYRLTAVHALLLPVIGVGAVVVFSFTAGLIVALAYGVAISLGIIPTRPVTPVAFSEVEDISSWEEPAPVETLKSDGHEPNASASFDEDAFKNEVATAAERYREAHATTAARLQEEQAAAAERLRKEQATKKISEAFIALKNNPSRARAFIARYKDNIHAKENGFVAAAWRIINERMIYSASNVIKCGDCWCLVEPPLLVSNSSPAH